MEALHYWRFKHPHPRVQLKMEVLWLKSFGLSHKDIAKYANVCEDTVTNYLREYKEEGIEGLKERHFYQPQSDLENYHSTLEAYFREHPPHTAKQAAQKIEELTGIKRSPQQVRTYLKKLGMKCIKVGQIPAKADITKQEKFLHEELQPKLEEARSGKRTVFFVDASHFVLSAFLGFVWCFVRIFIKTPSGRQRFNVLGALNAITHEVITITNTTYINAQSVCELLKKLAQNTVNKPITLVMDNARYQRCKLVTEYAKSLDIDLLFLPPYSPNLNLIERLWRFVKKKALYSEYYEDFASFKQAIASTLDQAQTTYQSELDSLLTLEFQSFKEVKLIKDHSKVVNMAEIHKFAQSVVQTTSIII